MTEINELNSNIRCIEIKLSMQNEADEHQLNSNIRCIEIDFGIKVMQFMNG